MGVDLSFKSRGERFNVRAAAIIKHEGYILCDYERGSDFSILPGGRIQRGEGSAVALKRELAEELEIDVLVGDPRVITESFYDGEQNERYHEIAFYYVIDRPKNLAFSPGSICHSHAEDGKNFDFSWVKATPEDLMRVNLEPKAIHHHFIDLPSTPIHVILGE